MVCFVLIILIWFVFFNSSLLVSHFKIVVVKQTNLKRTCFCFRTWFFLLWLLCIDFCFSIQVCWFLTSRWLFLNNKNIRKEHVFVFEYGLFCLDYYFWIQICWFLTSGWLFLNKQIGKEHVCALQHGLFCFDYCVSIFVFQFKFVGFSLQDGFLIQKISDKSMFLLSNMVCFVLIIVVWFVFFNSSLLVSHFKIVVVKQKIWNKHVFVFEHGLFCFDYCVLIIVFQFKFVGFSLQDSCFLNKNIRKEHVFVFEHGLFCLDYYFWIQICWFLTSRWFLNTENIRQEHVFAFEHGLFCFDYCVLIFAFQFKSVFFSLQDGCF